MAGVNLPVGVFSVAGAGFSGIGAGVAAGKAESVCLCAALQTGSQDAYVSVYIYNPTAGPPIIFQEPVRFRQPGGNPVLLQNFILTANTYLVVENHTPGVTMTFTLYNRWNFDA